MNATKETAKDLQTKLEEVNREWQELNTSITDRLSTIQDGKSAYELAKEHGYVGTVEEWLASLKGVKGDAGWLSLVNHGTADTTFALTPNAMHVWGQVSQLSLTLGTPIPNVVNEYAFEFQSPATPTNLLLPATLKWYNNYTPTIRAGKRYQASIVNDVIIMGEVEI